MAWQSKGLMRSQNPNQRVGKYRAPALGRWGLMF